MYTSNFIYLPCKAWRLSILGRGKLFTLWNREAVLCQCFPLGIQVYKFETTYLIMPLGKRVFDWLNEFFGGKFVLEAILVKKGSKFWSAKVWELFKSYVALSEQWVFGLCIRWEWLCVCCVLLPTWMWLRWLRYQVCVTLRGTHCVR